MLNLACLAIAIAPGGDSHRQADIVILSGAPYVRVVARANTFTQGRQDNAVLRPGADGNFTVSWQSRSQNKGTSGVYSRQFDRLGRDLSVELAGAPSGVAAVRPAPTQDMSQPVVEGLWRDKRELALFVGNRPLTKGTENQSGAVTASLSNGKTLVAWTEVRKGREQVFCKTLDTDRVTRLSDGKTACTNASVTATADGAVIVWQQADGQTLWAQRLDENGNRIGQAKTVVSGSAIEPSVAASGDRVVVAYCQMDSSGNSSVKSAVLDGNLDRVGDIVSVQGQSARQNGAAVAMRQDGTYAVAWNRIAGDDSDVYLQVFNRDGQPTGKAILAHADTKGDQRTLEASGVQRMQFDDKGLLIAWSGDSGLGDASAANFTSFVPKGDVAESDLVAMTSSNPSTQAYGKPQVPVLTMEKAVFESAGPHEPPLFATPAPWHQKAIEPSVNGGFNGFSQTSFTPPDMEIAVGPDHVVVTVNDGIAFYTKDGAQTYTAGMRLTTGFWGTLATGSDFIYDPECFYDQSTGRYFVMATQGNGTPTAGLVAVSDDSDPNGNWFKYRFSTQAFANSLFDSPNFGVDPNVLYLTGDAFNQATYPVFCIEKAPLLTGGNPTIKSALLPTSTQSAGIPDVVDQSEPAYYMVEHQEAGTSTVLRMIALTDPLGTPTFTNFNLTVPAYTAPEDPPQQGTTGRPNTFDQRMWNVQYRNGRIWATHHIGSSRVLARWYEIDPRGWPTSGNNPALVQSGDIVVGTTGRTFFPAIHADLQDNAAVYYARSSPTEFISASHSSRRYNDALGTMGESVVDKTSTAGYTGGRWGDYTGLGADPVYPSYFWGFGEWAEGQSWRAWVQPFRVTDEIWGTKFTVFRGILEEGTVKSLLKGDGSVMRVRNGIVANAAEPPASVILDTRCGVASPSSMSFTWTNRVTTAGLRQTIELFDWVANGWVEIDNRAATTTDQTVTVPASNPARFVQTGTGAMRARISAKAGGPVGASTWQMVSDKALWIVN